MKAILISIKPKYVAKILNGEKTIEIRKTTPKCDLPIDVYIYCTKDKDYTKLCKFECEPNTNAFLNLGKVVAKFTLNKVEEIKLNLAMRFFTKIMFEPEIANKSCLSSAELFNYLHNNSGYAWHISNLLIFDKPKELSEFYKGFRNKYYRREFGVDTYIDKYGVMVQPTKNGYEYTHKLTKAPQSWCYVEKLK